MEKLPRAERKALVARLVNDYAQIHGRVVMLMERSETALARSAYLREIVQRKLRHVLYGRWPLL